MDDLAESLWAAFSAETEEHLVAAEPLIAAAETETPSKDTIAQLFRDFHSLKGLARGMGMKSMEAVAHHAESLLGLVRSGDMALSGGIVGVLLEAIDALRGLRVLAVDERRDGELPSELVARLGALAVPDAVKPAAAARPEADIVIAASCLDADPDMCRYFSELLRDDLEDLGQRLVMLAAGAADDANVKRMHELLDELSHAAASMDLNTLATLFRALDEVLRPGLEWTMFHLLTKVEDFITTFEAETGLDAGGARFRSDIRDLLLGHGTQARGRLVEAVEALVREPPMLAQGIADRYEVVADVAGDLAHTLSIFPELAHRARPAFIIQDVFGRCRLGEFVPSHQTLAAALEMAEAMRSEAEPAVDFHAAFLASALADMGAAGENCSADFVRAFLRKNRVGDDLLTTLSPEAITEAAELMSKGWDRAFMVEARLDAAPDTSERFLHWLEGDVRVLTNRIFQRDGVTWYRFLLMGRTGPEAVREKLAEIDPAGHRTIRLIESAAAEPRPGTAQPGGANNTAIRVTSDVIDRFMAHIGELLLARSSIHLTLTDGGVETATARLRKVADGMTGDLADEILHHLDRIQESWAQLSRGDQHLHGVLKRLQESAMELRVVPIDTVFSRFPRAVRDIAQRTGKSVRLELAGRDVRIDKGMVEQLMDPLSHMVRNAIDHGIEPPDRREAAGKPATGAIRLSASQRGNRVLIEIADDGAGLDRTRILAKAIPLGLVAPADAETMADEDVYSMIFLPGFSTNDFVTETSGRGVGMDVVNVNIGRLGGRIATRSVPGGGTTFTLSLPLSAAIQDVLLVETGGQVLAIPERFLLEICEVEQSAFQTVRGQRAMLLRNSYLPVFALDSLLGLKSADARKGACPVLIIGSGAARMGVEVDRVARRQELYVKDIHARLLAIPGVGGASVLGDGRVVIIIDVEGLFRLAARGTHPVAMAAE